MPTPAATIMAGIPATNNYLYRRIRFLVGDPAAIIELPDASGRRTSTLIIRDIEMDRASKHARADKVVCPADFAPPGGLSGDRETATAQACAEFLRRAGQKAVTADRTLPLLFADMIQKAGISVECDPEMGVMERRAKDAQEVEHLRKAQRITEESMRLACELIARAKPRADGVLMHDGAPLTSERVRSEIDIFLLMRNFSNPPSIVAGGAQGGDCHDHGHGELRTSEPVIVDIFPKDRETLFNGDCTRTVVNGDISPQLAKMHKAVLEAKAAAIAATRPGITGQAVYEATIASLAKHGFARALAPAGAPPTFTSMQHGTGHGVGLDVHEPPLLDIGGPALIVGDALTIEPGLYSRAYGGVRVEDMVVVTARACENLDSLPDGLTWA